MRKLSILFAALAILLSDVMCATCAGVYTDIWWGMNYAGYSASPVDVTIFVSIPFLIGIIICTVLAIFFHKKFKKRTSNV